MKVFLQIYLWKDELFSLKYEQANLLWKDEFLSIKYEAESLADEGQAMVSGKKFEKERQEITIWKEFL